MRLGPRGRVPPHPTSARTGFAGPSFGTLPVTRRGGHRASIAIAAAIFSVAGPTFKLHGATVDYGTRPVTASNVAAFRERLNPFWRNLAAFRVAFTKPVRFILESEYRCVAITPGHKPTTLDTLNLSTEVQDLFPLAIVDNGATAI